MNQNEQKQVTGEEYLTRIIANQSNTLRNILMKELEKTHAKEMKEFEQRTRFLINYILQNHDPKTLAGKRVCIGRHEPNSYELELISKYFSILVNHVECIDIEEESYGAVSGTHKEYFIYFDGLNELYSKIRNLEDEIKRLKLTQKP